MPIALDPTAQVRVVLDSDATKENPPAFVFKHVSARQWIALTGALDSAGEKDQAGQLEELVLALARGLARTENLPEFTDLAELLTPAEAGELFAKWMSAIRMNGTDAKN